MLFYCEASRTHWLSSRAVHVIVMENVSKIGSSNFKCFTFTILFDRLIQWTVHPGKPWLKARKLGTSRLLQNVLIVVQQTEWMPPWNKEIYVRLLHMSLFPLSQQRFPWYSSTYMKVIPIPIPHFSAFFSYFDQHDSIENSTSCFLQRSPHTSTLFATWL